jgi:Fe-S cluster assembly protein SufD
MNRPIPIAARTDAEAAYIEAFDSAEMKLRGASDLRAAAMARFAASGLPSRRVEAWHYTDLRALLRQAAPVRTPDDFTVALARECLNRPKARTNSLRLVVLNGAFRPDLSDMSELPSQVTVTPLVDALVAGEQDVLAALAAEGQGGDDPIVALNTALMQDGVVVRIAPGARIERPIALVNMLAGGSAHASFVRSLVMVGEGASATLTETAGACTPAATQANDALVVKIADGARLDCIARVTAQGQGAVALHSLLATVGADAEFNAFAFLPDPSTVRRQIFVRLNGRNSRVRLGGLSLLRGKEHADTTLVVDHAVPDCVSREFYRHILDHESTGVFQGKVVVRQHAQKTDGAMKSQALMLGDDAVMNNKPELEIFADDVVCGHGATVGQLDDDQIFYLQSRGLSRAESESLLLEAFANEALDLVADETLRERFAAETREWLSRRDAA